MSDDFWEQRAREQRHHDAMMNAGKQGEGVANFLTGMAEAVSRDYKNATRDSGGSNASGGEYRMPVYDTIPTYSSQREYREGFGEGGYTPSYDGPVPTSGDSSEADLLIADLEKDLAKLGRFIASASVFCFTAAINLLALPYKGANALYKKTTGEFAPVKSAIVACATWAGIGTAGLAVTENILALPEHPAMTVSWDKGMGLVFTYVGRNNEETDLEAAAKCSVDGGCINIGNAVADHPTCVLVTWLPPQIPGVYSNMTYDAKNPGADALLEQFARAYATGMPMEYFTQNLSFYCNSNETKQFVYSYLHQNPQILAP